MQPISPFLSLFLSFLSHFAFTGNRSGTRACRRFTMVSLSLFLSLLAMLLLQLIQVCSQCNRNFNWLFVCPLHFAAQLLSVSFIYICMYILEPPPLVLLLDFHQQTHTHRHKYNSIWINIFSFLEERTSTFRIFSYIHKVESRMILIYRILCFLSCKLTKIVIRINPELVS